MAIQYAAGTRVNTTFSGATKATIRDGIEAGLLAAGWTTVSGSGSTDLLMQSAVTPQSLQVRARFRDYAGTCVVCSPQDVAGSFSFTVNATNGCHLLPAAGKTFRIIANQYQFFVFTAVITAAREYVGSGVPYVPDFLVTAGAYTKLGWMSGNSQSDTDTTVRPSFRTSMHHEGYNMAFINGNFIAGNTSAINSQAKIALQTILGPQTGVTAPSGPYRWHDDSAMVRDAILSWGLSTLNDEPKARGLLWDAFVSTESYTGDLTTSYDGHNWFVITNGNTAVDRGSLFICVP